MTIINTWDIQRGQTCIRLNKKLYSINTSVDIQILQPTYDLVDMTTLKIIKSQILGFTNSINAKELKEIRNVFTIDQAVDQLIVKFWCQNYTFIFLQNISCLKNMHK